MACQIDKPEDVEARVYVEASYANPFRSGWGAVIDRQGEILELSEAAGGETAPRLLLLGCVEALSALPAYLPVRVICSVEYLTRWTLPKLREMRTDGFKNAAKRKLAHLDLISDLGKVIYRRPYVQAVTVRKAEWDYNHKRADLLARHHGSDGVDMAAASRGIPRDRPSIEHASVKRSYKVENQVKPEALSKLPWEE